ncbi:MAG: hypothetical protein BKP49_03360 [Treponema sp. CETP13]|nr:MAG: hypothetical protein BKP49_03360 [Treponema sp. CETP13]
MYTMNNFFSDKKIFPFFAIFVMSSVLFLFGKPVVFFAQSVNDVAVEVSNTQIAYNGSGTYWMVERSNFSRYDNGQYTGHTSREVRSFVYPISAPSNSCALYKNDSWFDGSFMVSEKTKHNSSIAAIGLEGSIPACFHIAADGTLKTKVDNGFPTFRSFPAYSADKVSVGDKWVASAERAVDPLNKGIWTRLPMTVEYTFKGAETYKGKDVYKIHAQWATRYGMMWMDYNGDPDLQSAQGKHEADILVLQETGAAYVISDYVDETFVYSNNQTVRLKGTLTLFTEFPPSVDTDSLLPSFSKIATIAKGTSSNKSNEEEPKKPQKQESDSIPVDKNTLDVTPTSMFSGTEGVIENVEEGELDDENIPLKNNMVVEKTPAGLRLSVRDAHFKANSAEMEDGEAWRLDVIAETLVQIPDAKFLIEGHTAAIGSEEGEKELSLARAEYTAKELEKRGISIDHFICKGLGRDYPVATNDTVEGRAQNRRVEITILQ